MRTRVPGGSRGVQLKSIAPFRYASADWQGFVRAGRRRFNVSSNFLMRRSHKCRGEFGLQLESPAMRWALNVCIAFSGSV